MPNIINKTDILKVLDRISHAELMATMERSFTSYIIQT